MYCKKCYTKLEEDWKCCPNCSTVIKQENVEINEETIKLLEKKEKTNAIIYLIVFLACFICSFLVDKASGIFFVASLITIVTGYITCPNSKILKIVFWLFLIFIVLAIIVMIIITIMCGQMLVGCYSNCGG